LLEAAKHQLKNQSTMEGMETYYLFPFLKFMGLKSIGTKISALSQQMLDCINSERGSHFDFYKAGGPHSDVPEVSTYVIKLS
jgi:hypothetical protein